MEFEHTPGNWKATFESGMWKVRSSDGTTIASVEKSNQGEANARLIAASLMMFEALAGLVQLIGDEDLPEVVSRQVV